MSADVLPPQNSHLTSLHTYLRSIRQAYLSTSQPPRRTHLGRSDSSKSLPRPAKERTYFSDEQRDQIDAESKQLLRQLNSSIRNLADAEQLRYDTQLRLAQRKQAQRGLGALGRWAAGGSKLAKTPEDELEQGRADAIRTHRESVLFYLRRELEACGEAQRSMMETRLGRELEKSKSVLYKTHAVTPGQVPGLDHGSSTGAAANPVAGRVRSQADGRGARMDELEQDRIEQELSPEQLQLFAQENQDLLKHYEDTLDQVRYAEWDVLLER